MTESLEMHEPVFGHGRPLASGIPLGGLGTGSVEIMETGRFRDWEIFNNYQWSGNRAEAAPEMWSEDSFFAIRVKQSDGPPRVRLLYLEDDPINSLSPKKDNAFIYNFPFLKNVEGIRYSGQFPFARLQYEDASLPVEVELEAFSPFIPHNAKDSGLPLAFFTFTVRNNTASECETSLMFSLRNCTGYDRESLHLKHDVVRAQGSRTVLMGAEDLDPEARTHGSTAVSVIGTDDELCHMTAWTGGRGGTEGKMQAWDLAADEEVAQRETTGFSQVFFPYRDEGVLPGDGDSWSRKIKKLHPEPDPGTLQSPIHRVGWVWNGAVGRKVRIGAGEEQRFVFIMSWYYPNHYHYKYQDERLGHMYENWFSGAGDVARYGAENMDRLHRESRAFADETYESSLPHYVPASLNAQLTTLAKSVFWTKDGDMALWEGQACCQALSGGRTPWSTWALLALFPDVYNNMVRPIVESSLGETPEETGHLLVDLRRKRRNERNAQRGSKSDRLLAGRFGTLGYTKDDVAQDTSPREGGPKQVLLESQWSGDRSLLVDLWPTLKESMDKAIDSDENDDGLPSGLSGLTYDHWFVPATNCYRCSMWLADLRAAVRIARIVGDEETASRYGSVLEKGMDRFEKLFWNGDYYRFCYDPKIDRFDEGCMADQVSGQLFCRLLGMPSVHDEDRVLTALRAVHTHNLVEEEGLLNGSDPKGREDWRYFAAGSPDGYNEARGGQWPTPWTGTEYYVAAVMAAEGLWTEALDVIKNVYDRHVRAGMVYNHIECGEHYFRALAVWAILPAVQGLLYDPADGLLGFTPKNGSDELDSMFVLPGLWGRLSLKTDASAQISTVAVKSGEVSVEKMVVKHPGRRPAAVSVAVNGEAVASQWSDEGTALAVQLDSERRIQKGDEVTVSVSL